MRTMVMVAGSLALAAGACNMNEPSYFPASAPVEIGGGAMGEPFAVIQLPFRAPRDDEQQALREESATRKFTVPWLRTETVAVSLLYTVTNLGDTPATARLQVDGASEFANYDTIALRAAAEMANNEDEVEILPLLEVVTPSIAPGSQFTSVLREDDFDEAALDLDALGRFGAAPAAVLVNNSQKNRAGLEMMPPQHVRPALWQIRTALSGTGHLRLDVVARVRDEADQLLKEGETPWIPSPTSYTPPMMPPAP